MSSHPKQGWQRRWENISFQMLRWRILIEIFFEACFIGNPVHGWRMGIEENEWEQYDTNTTHSIIYVRDLSIAHSRSYSHNTKNKEKRWDAKKYGTMKAKFCGLECSTHLSFLKNSICAKCKQTTNRWQLLNWFVCDLRKWFACAFAQNFRLHIFASGWFEHLRKRTA